MDPRTIAGFARALHASGAPAHVVEGQVVSLLDALRIDGAVAASPTAIWLQIGEQSRVLRLEPGDPHLERLTALYRWHTRVVDTPDWTDAEAALDAIRTLPSRWSPAVQTTTFAGVSAGMAWLLGGTAVDLIAGGLAGLLVNGVFQGLASPAWRPLATALAGLVAGTTGGFAALAGASAPAVAIAGVIVVVPGLGMTTSLAEVASGHWSSGSARLLGAFASAAQIAAGLAIGAAITAHLPVGSSPATLPGAAIALPLLAPAAFGILLQARARQLPTITVVSLAGFVLATQVGGPIGAGVAALAVGVAANVLARTQRLPALVTSVPGILLLVPGSVGVRGVGQLLHSDALAGTTTAVEALMAAGALALGLLASHALFPAQPPKSSAITGPSGSRSEDPSKAARTASDPLASSGGPHSRSSASVP